MQCGEQPVNNIQHPVIQSCTHAITFRLTGIECMPVTFGCLCSLSQQNTVLKNMTPVLLKKQRRNWTLHRSQVRCLEHSDVLVLESFQRRSHEAVFRQDQARCRLSTEHQASTRYPPGIPRPQPGLVSCQVHQQSDGFGLLFGRDSMVEEVEILWNLGNTSYIRLYL